MVQAYYQNDPLLQKSLLKYWIFFWFEYSSKWVKIFQETASVEDENESDRPRAARSTENIVDIAQSFDKRLATSFYLTIYKGYYLQRYKIQLSQNFKPTRYSPQRTFVHWLLQHEAGFSCKSSLVIKLFRS